MLHLNSFSASATVSAAMQAGSLKTQNWAETTVVSWTQLWAKERGVVRVTSSQIAL